MKIFVRYLLISLASLLVACDKPVIISADAILPNGAVYEGDIENGKFNGTGKLVYPSKAYYEGQFKDGLFNGKGTLVDSDGNKYEGDFSDGEYHGKGLLSFASEGHYEGEFVDGKYHGIGEFVRGEHKYTGEFVDGTMSGQGSYIKGGNETYNGELKNWVANGKGVKKEDGALISGIFVDGFIDGEGEIIYSDGSIYKGSIAYDKADGKGIRIYANKSIYEGEFSYGRRHGIGTFKAPKTNDSNENTVSGKWKNDALIHDFSSGEFYHSQVEIALKHHQDLLEQAHTNLGDQADDKTDVYFLGIAGDGSQSVFKREIEFVQPLIEARYGNSGKLIVLINHHDTAKQYPMATGLSISSSIEAIANKMDKQNDILFMYLTSHGSKTHELYLNHDGMNLPSFSAKALGSALESSNIKWKVIVISACYSGGFIQALKDDTTLVVTAADAESPSFGCSEDSEMTYFGRAFFREVLSNNEELSLSKAFKLAKKYVTEWEDEKEFDPSNPQIHADKAIIKKIASVPLSKEIR